MTFEDQIAASLHRRSQQPIEAKPSLAAIELLASSDRPGQPTGAPVPRRRGAVLVSAAAATILVGLVVAITLGGRTTGSADVAASGSGGRPSFGVVLGGMGAPLDGFPGVERPESRVTVTVYSDADSRHAVALFRSASKGQASIDAFPARYEPIQLGSVAAETASPDEDSQELRRYSWGSGSEREVLALRGFSDEEGLRVAVALSRGEPIGQVVPDGLALSYDGLDRNPFLLGSDERTLVYRMEDGSAASATFLPGAASPAHYAWFLDDFRESMMGDRIVTMLSMHGCVCALWAEGGGVVLIIAAPDQLESAVQRAELVDESTWSATAAEATEPESHFGHTTATVGG